MLNEPVAHDINERVQAVAAQCLTVSPFENPAYLPKDALSIRALPQIDEQLPLLLVSPKGIPVGNVGKKLYHLVLLNPHRSRIMPLW